MLQGVVHTFAPQKIEIQNAVLTQVVPTVGVGGEGAEGEKKVAAQLKHFRNLVDEQASKVGQLPPIPLHLSEQIRSSYSA